MTLLFAGRASCIPVTLRPIDDITVGNWEDIVGGNSNGLLADELNEVSPDNSGSYINLPGGVPQGLDFDAAGREFEVLLSSSSDNHGNCRHLLSVVLLSGGTLSNPIDLRFRIVQGSTIISTDFSGDIGGGWATKNVLLDESEIANITDWSDLRLRMSVRNVNLPPPFLPGIFVTWAQLQIF